MAEIVELGSFPASATAQVQPSSVQNVLWKRVLFKGDDLQETPQS